MAGTVKHTRVPNDFCSVVSLILETDGGPGTEARGVGRQLAVHQNTLIHHDIRSQDGVYRFVSGVDVLHEPVQLTGVADLVVAILIQGGGLITSTYAAEAVCIAFVDAIHAADAARTACILLVRALTAASAAQAIRTIAVIRNIYRHTICKGVQATVPIAGSVNSQSEAIIERIIYDFSNTGRDGNGM